MRQTVLIALSNGDSAIAEAIGSPGIEIHRADSVESSMELVRQTKPDVGIIDCSGPADRVIRFLEDLRSLAPTLLVILVGPAVTALAAPFLGGIGRIFDCWELPLDSLEFARQLQVAFATARDSNPSVAHSLDEEKWTGTSIASERILRAIRRISDADVCTLIAGEPGIGKGFAARTIHRRSRRNGSFFVRVDCATDPAVLDRDLFGGSHPPRLSRLEQARGGTLFLSHVERMPDAVQMQLVHWLLAASRSPGSGWPDTRITASVMGSPENAVDQGFLRQDLFNLLNVGRIDLPPLRDRPEDILPLASYFLGRFPAESLGQTKSLALVVSRVLSRHPWPENVRELEQVLHRANMSASTDVIQLGDLPANFLNDVGPSLLAGARIAGTAAHNRFPEDLDGLAQKLFQWARTDVNFQIIPAVERCLIMQAMAETNGNQVQASKLLGITRATLRKRLVRFNIRLEVVIR